MDADLESVVAGLQKENEGLRFEILKLRNARSPLELLDTHRIRRFITDNYLLLIAAFLLLSFSLSLVETMRQLFPRKRRSDDA